MVGGKQFEYLFWELVENWIEEGYDLVDYWCIKSYYFNFIICIDVLVEVGEVNIMFIVVDMLEIYEVFQECYEDWVVFLLCEVNDCFVVQLCYVLVDVILFSCVLCMFGSIWSFFFELVQCLVYFLMMVEMSGIDFQVLVK